MPASVRTVLLTQTLYRTCQRTLLSSACQNASNQHVQQKPKPFPVINKSVDTTASDFLRNSESYKKYTEKYAQIMAFSKAGGGEKGVARHTKVNKKLLASDRVKLLLDESEEFFELSAMAGFQMPYGDIARAGILMGIGKIQGKYCLIIANDGSVKGGTVFPISLKKQLRGQEIAKQNRIPCVYAVDSGGAFLPLQSEIFTLGGQTFYNEAVMSSMGIPQVAIVCGNCTAGGAYVPTMADEAVIIHRIGTIFLGGPPLVQAATGEVISAEELGGATLHCSVSGCTDYYAENEEMGFQMGRDIVEGLNLPCPRGPQRDPEEPLFDPQEIYGLIPSERQETMDMKAFIARIVDGSRFNEFKTQFGSTLITGFAYIQGYLVGIVGNQGEITDTAAAKGAHFVQMCSERHIPLVFLHNTTPTQQGDGFGVTGGNFVRDHAKMLGAVSCAQVPKISVVVGNSIGQESYLMCGRSVSPNFMFTWPNAVIGMMEPDQLVSSIVQELQGQSVDPAEQDELVQKLLTRYNTEMSAFHISANLNDDGVILPHDTRQVIGRCLDICSAYVPRKQTAYPVIRM